MRNFVEMIQEELNSFVEWIGETQLFDSKDEEFEYAQENFWSRTADEYKIDFDFDENFKVFLPF